MKLGHILAPLLADSAFGRKYGSDRSKCEIPECCKDFIMKNVEIREDCDLDGLESGTLVYLNNCKVDKTSLHIEWDEKTQMDIKGEYRLRFVTQQYTFVKQPRETGCHCYDLGWSQFPILLEKFEEGFYCSDYSNFTDCSGIDYRKDRVSETFRYKERGPLRSLGKYYKYTKHVQLLDSRGNTIKLEHSDKLGYPYINNVGRSTSDYLTKFPASLKNNSFVRANETIKSCEQQDGSACYLNTVYSHDLVEGSEYHDHRLGDIRLTSTAYTPDKVSLFGTFLRDANNRISIGKFGIVLWYTADCDRSLQNILNDWQNWYNKTYISSDDVLTRTEVTDTRRWYPSLIIAAVVNLLLAILQPVEKMVKQGKEYRPNEYETFRAIKWTVIMVMLGLVIYLLVAHPVSKVLEIAETCLLSLVLTFMVQLRKHCLEKRGFVVEGNNGNAETDSSHGNPQDVEYQCAHESPQENEEREPLGRRRMKK